MEDVLDVYHRPPDPKRPLVCFDEGTKQQVQETRLPLPVQPGSPAKHDYEYERNGTSNLFMMFAPLESWRHVKVTDHHTRAEIELSVLSRQCLNRRIPDQIALQQAVEAWQAQRNHACCTVKWQFTTADARIKLTRLYQTI